MRILIVAAVLILGSMVGPCPPAAGQGTSVLRLPGPPPLTLPGWLGPYPKARDRSAKATSEEATSSFLALGSLEEVVGYYDRQLQSAGIDFRTRPDSLGVLIRASTEKIVATLRIHGEEGGIRVEVRYGVRVDPPTPPEDLVIAPLTLEWPDWLEVPGGRLVSERTNPRGRFGKGLEDTCPGDVLGKPSQGCLQKVYQSSRQLRDLYEYFDDLLYRHGFVTQGSSTKPYAYIDLGKTYGAPFASITMRQFPVPQDETSYRQFNIFLRQPQVPGPTKVEIAFLVNSPQIPETSARNVTGLWAFTHVNDRFRGTISLRQSGPVVTGIWHTSYGKTEPDDQVSGQIEGDTVYLTRFIAGSDLKQEYVLQVSPDGTRIDGFGEGFGLQHSNLNMRPAGRSQPTGSQHAMPGKAAPR
ncbi:MAG TPA: hypothetical protein VMH81_06485 [Bryobacteraceae bacterium]|nr:hypothetical protein [Bryobacteraceae bacterium]